MSSATRTPRTVAREIAFQYLYKEDLNPQEVWSSDVSEIELTGFVGQLLQALEQDEVSASDHVEDVEAYRHWQRSGAMIAFAHGLVDGVRRHRAKIDQSLSKLAENWSLDRMTATDRNVLRLGAYEILYGDTPGRVAINEALELAKRYGTAQSAQFVNGLLDRLMHDRQKSPASGPPADPGET